MEEKTADVQDSHGSGIIASLFDKARLAKIGQVPRNKKYTFNKDLFKLDYGDSVASLTIQDIHSNLTETLPRWMGTKEMDKDNKVYNAVDRQEEYGKNGKTRALELGNFMKMGARQTGTWKEDKQEKRHKSEGSMVTKMMKAIIRKGRKELSNTSKQERDESKSPANEKTNQSINNKSGGMKRVKVDSAYIVYRKSRVE